MQVLCRDPFGPSFFGGNVMAIPIVWYHWLRLLIGTVCQVLIMNIWAQVKSD